MAQGSTFPTPFNINRIQGIPGPKGDPGSTGPEGPGQGVDCTTKGCVGDGTTDNTAGFALASTAASSDPSRTVYVPAGSYKLASTQTISANLKFAPGATIKPASGQTITLSGQIEAGDYQQLFDTSLGGIVKLSNSSKVNPCWFGADPGGNLGTTRAAIHAAIACLDTGDAGAGFGNLQRKLDIPEGHYRLEKPVLLTANGQNLYGQGDISTLLEARDYVGPGIVISDPTNAHFTLHANDYAGLNSASIGPLGQIQLNHYGDAWDLNGQGQFSIDIIAHVDSTVFSYFLASSGSDEKNGTHSAFAILCDPGTFGPYSASAPGIGFTLTLNGTPVTIFTAASALNTTGFHHIRCDYDGSAMRIFVDGVAQTLAGGGTSHAVTGNISMHVCETIMLGEGTYLGFDGFDLVWGAPTGCKMACLRMGTTSRGSSNFSPPAGKYSEDGSTKFLLNFDTSDGCLLFARCYSAAFSTNQDAWLPPSAGSTQTGGYVLKDLSVFAFGGPALLVISAPSCRYEGCNFFGQMGAVFDNNCYTSSVKDCAFEGGPRNIALKLGPACNFMSVKDCFIRGGSLGLYAMGISIVIDGWTYIVTPAYSCLYFETCFNVQCDGSLFLSDEGSSFDNPYSAVVCGSTANVNFRGTLFGSQGHTDQVQLLIDNSGGSALNNLNVFLDGCVFSPNTSATGSPVQIFHAGTETTLTEVSSQIYPVSFAHPLVGVDSTALQASVRQLSDGPAWIGTKGLLGPAGARAEADLPASIITTNATPVTLFSFAMADLTDLRMDVIVKAKDLTDTSKGASWNLSADYRRNGAGPVIDGTLTKVANGSNAGAPPTGIDCTITTSGNNVIVQATGDASDHYKWVCAPQEITVT